MENNNMQNLFAQFDQMLKSGNIPDELKNIVSNINNSSSNKTTVNTKGDSNSNSSQKTNNDATYENSNDFDFSDIDLETILKMKQVLEAMNSKKDDPRANLLLSLKPYLKKSRQDKVEQYIKLFNMGKVFETFNSLGGDVKHEL